MEIGKNNNHLLHSVLLWTLYWMTQRFAFQSFKNCAGICRASCKENEEMRMKMPQSLRARQFSKGESLDLPRSQWSDSAGSHRSHTTISLTAESLTASQDSVENSSKKELRNKKLTELESMLQAGGLCCRAAHCSPSKVLAPAGLSPWHRSEQLWCLQPQLP